MFSKFEVMLSERGFVRTRGGGKVGFSTREVGDSTIFEKFLAGKSIQNKTNIKNCRESTLHVEKIIQYARFLGVKHDQRGRKIF